MSERNHPLPPLEILYADDNDGDVELTIEAAKESGIECTVHAVSDGEEAIAFLKKSGNFLHSPTPDLIMLDWNMPKMSGLETLATIKNTPGINMIPVVIFSSSSVARYIKEAYEAGASCYIAKPVDFDKYMECIVGIVRFWSQTSRIGKG